MHISRTAHWNSKASKVLPPQASAANTFKTPELLILNFRTFPAFLKHPLNWRICSQTSISARPPTIKTPVQFATALILTVTKTLRLLTRVAVPIKKTACLPPTPKYEMSLLRDRGAATDDDDDDDDVTLGEFSTPSWLSLNLHNISRHHSQLKT